MGQQIGPLILGGTRGDVAERDNNPFLTVSNAPGLEAPNFNWHEHASSVWRENVSIAYVS